MRFSEIVGHDTQSPEAVRIRLGDPARRAEVRTRFFAEVREPRGRDLVLLDFTELAYATLDLHSQVLPWHERLRNEDLLAMSRAVAQILVEGCGTGAREPSEQFEDRLERAIKEHADLPSVVSRKFAIGVLHVFARFAFEICETCEGAVWRIPIAMSLARSSLLGIPTRTTGDR
jgi:hypothetical protein